MRIFLRLFQVTFVSKTKKRDYASEVTASTQPVGTSTMTKIAARDSATTAALAIITTSKPRRNATLFVLVRFWFVYNAIK